MKLFVAKNSGFCKGVKSAVETAMNIDPVNTFLLGELIHNELINDAVRARGIVTVESVSDVPDGATLITDLTAREERFSGNAKGGISASSTALVPLSRGRRTSSTD